MKPVDARAFASVFRDAYRKCFADELSAPLSEPESIRLSVEIEEATGLEVGWKSLKNYSQHVLGTSPGRSENPSTPTLDTLARYVAGAPATTREERQRQARHYPYWHDYREQYLKSQPGTAAAPPTLSAHALSPRKPLGVGAALTAIVVLLIFAIRPGARPASFLDEFDDVSAEGLAERGWQVAAVDSLHWSKRDERPGHLTLYTLSGDNWPQAGRMPVIRNLLLRAVPPECFVAEVRLVDFFPGENWQQAGILLLEDTAFSGRSLRLSIGFNDFAGGFPRTPEIIVQAVTSLGRAFANPEELAHHRLFGIEPGSEALIRENLQHAALRIEKRRVGFRLLYSAGPVDNAGFQEVVSTEFPMRATRVGVFALKGFVVPAGQVPVHLDRFSTTGYPCAE